MIYMLIAADIDQRRLTLPSAREVVATCVAAKTWGIGDRTHNRKSMKAGETVLLYASGIRKGGRAFLGIARIAEGPVRREWLGFPLSIHLDQIRIFRTPVPIGSVLKELSFWKRARNKTKWGAALQGGCRRIEPTDLDAVLSMAKEVA